MDDIKHPPQAYTCFMLAELVALAVVFAIERGLAAVLFKTYLTSVFFALMAVGLVISKEEIFERAASNRYLDLGSGMRGVIFAASWPNRLLSAQMPTFQKVSAIAMFAVVAVCLTLY